MANEPLTVVTWNVNSLRSRMDRVLAWTDRHRPSVLCLQETKCSDEQFCADAFEALGYHACFAGETSGRNGVAIVADAPLEDVVTRLPGRDDDEQRRFLSARVHGLRVIDCYVPNGQAVGSEAFFYKLDWLARLQAHLVESHDPAQPLAVVGDFNICPEARDVYDPPAYEGRLHFTEFERRALGYLQAWGLKDALRLLHEEPGIYTWFDYRWTLHGLKKVKGLRIDLIYVTEPLAARLESVEVDLEERAGENPSDHAPLVARFR